MLMTEEDAKAKACCNGAKRPAENGPCIGPACMAWRWGEKTYPLRIALRNGRGDVDWEAKEEPARPANVPSFYRWEPADPDDERYAAWVEPDDEAQARRTGYCGLAGQPWVS